MFNICVKNIMFQLVIIILNTEDETDSIRVVITFPISEMFAKKTK